MEDRKVFKRTIAVLAAVYIIMTSLVSAGLLVSRSTSADNEIRKGISMVDLYVQQKSHDGVSEGAMENIKNNIDTSTLNSMLAFGGVEAAVFDGNYELITATSGDWMLHTTAEDGSMRKLSFPPDEYLSEDDIEKIQKLYEYNSSHSSTKVGDVHEYALKTDGWIAADGRYVPTALRSLKNVVKKSSADGTSLSTQEIYETVFDVKSSEPEEGSEKVSSVYIDSIGQIYTPYGGLSGIRGSKKQNAVREIVRDPENVRAIVDARNYKAQNGEAIAISELHRKYNYSLSSYSDGSGVVYHIACAYSYNVIADSIGMLAFLWLGSLAVFAAAAAVLISGIRSNIRQRRELEERRRYLTNSLAHDLKAPLAVISGCAQNIRENVMPEKHSIYTERIEERAEYMSVIISEMLDMTRTDSGGELCKSRFSLKAAAEESFSACEELGAGKNISFSICGDADITADKRLISKVIDNFLINALRFTPDNGVIEVTVTSGKFSVYNSGSSVPEDMTDRIWDAYTKADPSRGMDGGNGLGLSIAASVLKRHGFKYGAQNTEDGFMIWFSFGE